MRANLQMKEEYEGADIPPQPQQVTTTYRPLIASLTDPIDVLHFDSAHRTSGFKKRQGRWAYGKPGTGTPEAQREYSVRVMAFSIPNTVLYLSKDDKQIKTIKTDENGKASLSLPVNQATTGDYVVSLNPNITQAVFGQSSPLSDAFIFTVWAVTCSVKNRTDVWWRHVGRSFEDKLHSRFWTSKNPKRGFQFIGLAAPYGVQRFIDFVPLFDDQDATLEYGISAYCNTREPYPKKEDCLAARVNTWWDYKVTAFNGKASKEVTGALNIDRHLKVTLEADDIHGEVIKSDGAET